MTSQIIVQFTTLNWVNKLQYFITQLRNVMWRWVLNHLNSFFVLCTVIYIFEISDLRYAVGVLYFGENSCRSRSGYEQSDRLLASEHEKGESQPSYCTLAGLKSFNSTVTAPSLVTLKFLITGNGNVPLWAMFWVF